MKDIKGYEGLYAVTEDGQIWSYKSNIFLKPYVRKDGYVEVYLWKNGVKINHLLHRLIATAYLPNLNNFPQVNHKDENKLNNAVENLEWCTAIYNMNYSHSKPVFCEELNKVFCGAREAARQLGLASSGITRCCQGRYKTCGGYHWRYTDE